MKSSIYLFADDCLLYRAVRSIKDHITLQEGLKNLEAWGMKFNSHTLNIQENSYYY